MTHRVNAAQLVVLAFSLFVACPFGWAFELFTHEQITRVAFARLVASDVLRDLGIDPATRLNGGFLRASRLPVDWLVAGVRDEDATVSAELARYRHHFYDPINDRGLTTSLVRGERAPDWALEDRQEFPTQDFSYRDARQAFQTVLTAPAPGDREAALARTFEILGHVIHLIQDMASPPHTRNDMHGGFGFGPSSLYERHLNQPQVLGRLNFNGTPVRLRLPREYWTTGDGRGLAEFVNRNFVSEGTNFRARVDGAIGGGYPSPVLRLGLDEQGRPFETTLDIQKLEPGLRDTNGNLIEGNVTFFASNFRDPITGQPLRNERMTTLSLFDRELERRGESLVFTLNRYNVEAQGAFLIPRALGYSAGLLDYFLRGRLEVGVMEEGPEERVLEVINRSPEPLGAGGTLTLYADDGRGSRTPVPGATIAVVEAVPPDNDGQDGRPAPLQMRFTVPPSVARYALVYRGPLGSEQDAIIGKVFGGGVLEQIFRDFAKGLWVLRTPTALFALPLDSLLPPGERAEDVAWGSSDNIILGFFPSTFFGTRKVYQFQINRLPGSADVPLTGEQTGDLPTVALTLRQTIDLTQVPPLPTGATVQAQGSLSFQQYLTTIEEDHFFEWGDSGLYDLRTVERRISVSQVQDLTETVSAAYPLVLDTAHGPGAPQPLFYRWSLLEAASTTSGDILGLLEVSLAGDFPGSSRSIPLIVHNSSGALVPASQLNPPISEFVPNYSFLPPSPGPLLAAVNLTRNTLLATTFKRDITQHGHYHQDHVTLAGLHLKLHFVGGPDAGDREEWLRTSLSLWNDLEPPATTTTINTILGSEQTVEVWPEALIPLGIPGGAATVQHQETLYSPASRSRTEAILHHREIRAVSPPDFRLGAGLFCDPGAAAGVPARTPLAAAFARSHVFPNEVKVLRWDPASQSAQQALHESAFIELRACNRDWALLLDTWQRRSWLIPMEGIGESLTFPTLLSDHVLLPGSLLYQAREQRFYRVGPALTPLSGGPPLAPAPELANRPWWPYHLAGR